MLVIEFLGMDVRKWRGDEGGGWIKAGLRAGAEKKP